MEPIRYMIPKKVRPMPYLALLQGLLVQYDFNISFSENFMNSVVF